MNRPKAIYAVYLNGERIGQCPATKAAARAWIRDHVTSTHMGEWRRCGADRHYHTSIGRVYAFMRTSDESGYFDPLVIDCEECEQTFSPANPAVTCCINCLAIDRP